jgi:hypothetical protein
MPASKLDRLIAQEAGEPVYIPLTQERLDDRLYTAVLFNGSIAWQSVGDPQLPGGRQLYVREGDRG